jgi:serine/threonine-protein kinase
MALEPDRRYPTPRTLADDIEGWMADLPIRAYREPLRRRLARWERRHKALVQGGIAVLAITAVGLAFARSIVLREKQTTEKAMKEAEISTMAVRANLLQAIRAVFFTTQVADREFNVIPRMGPVRQRLVEQAASDFDDFLKMLPEDPELVRQAEEAYRNAALVRWLTGDFSRARDGYRRAIELLEKLPAMVQYRDPADRLKLAVANRAMGDFLAETGHDQEATPYYEQALSLTGELFAESAELRPYTRNELAHMSGWLAVRVGNAELDRGDREQAGQSYGRAIELLAPINREPGHWYWYRLLVSMAHRGLGKIARQRKDKAADREFAEAERIARSVVKHVPDPDPDPRQVLACTLVARWQEVAIEPGRAGAADAALDEAVALLEGIASDFPEVAWYRADRAEALLARATRNVAAGRVDRAERDLTEAHRLLAELMAKDHENWNYPGHCGRVEVELARLRKQQGRAREASELLQQGIEHLETACKHRPQHIRDRQSLDDARQLVIDKASDIQPKRG